MPDKMYQLCYCILFLNVCFFSCRNNKQLWDMNVCVLVDLNCFTATAHKTVSELPFGDKAYVVFLFINVLDI